MKNIIIQGIAAIMAASLFSSLSLAQMGGNDVYWWLDPSVKECSMVIDPSLTQAQWREFTRQVGAISAFKSLSPATTLGTLNYRVEIDYGRTAVDQHSLVWINTFVHPDADCPLGDHVVIPTLRASVGVSDNIDVGGYWITNPRANYGMVGAEMKYAFMQESDALPAAAARASVTFLTGVPDFDLSIYSVDVLASKSFAGLTPYVGLRGILSVGTETTSKVNLDGETVPLAQGYVGISYSLWMITVAAEYNVSTVNTLAFALGVGF